MRNHAIQRRPSPSALTGPFRALALVALLTGLAVGNSGPAAAMGALTYTLWKIEHKEKTEELEACKANRDIIRSNLRKLLADGDEGGMYQATMDTLLSYNRCIKRLEKELKELEGELLKSTPSTIAPDDGEERGQGGGQGGGRGNNDPADWPPGTFDEAKIDLEKLKAWWAELSNDGNKLEGDFKRVPKPAGD